MNTWKSIKDIWMKIMYVLSPSQKKLGVLIFIMTIFGAVVEMLGVSVIVPLVQALMDVNKLMNNKIISKLIVAFNLVNTNQVIFAIVGSVICLYIFKNVYLFILLYIRSKYSYKIQRELSVKIMQSYMKRNYSFF